MSLKKPESKAPKSQPTEARLFWERRGLKNRGLIAFALAVLTLIVFHNPRAWADGSVATVINYGAWLLLGASALVMYWADVKAAECHGYCRGKFGLTPMELREFGTDQPAN